MSKGRVLLFSLLLSAICAGLLGAARTLTAESIARNMELDEWRSILEAAGFQPEGGRTILQMPARELEEVYRARVAPAKGADPQRGPFGYTDETGKQVAQVIRIRGKGLWGDMFGFLAVNPTPRAGGKLLLQGITFYREEETPGLGKRIHESKFRGQFRPDQGRLAPGLDILKGEGNAGLGPDRVDGITSATVTSAGVEAMIEDGAKWYLEWKQGGGR